MADLGDLVPVDFTCPDPACGEHVTTDYIITRCGRCGMDVPYTATRLAPRELPSIAPEFEIERDNLLSISVAYLLDRDVMDATFPPLSKGERRCRYCKGSFMFVGLGKFAGHVRCATSLAFQRRLVLFLDQNPALTFWSVATALGVTPAIIRAWWSNIKSPKSGRRHPDEIDNVDEKATRGT